MQVKKNFMWQYSKRKQVRVVWIVWNSSLLSKKGQISKIVSFAAISLRISITAVWHQYHLRGARTPV